MYALALEVYLPKFALEYREFVKQGSKHLVVGVQFQHLFIAPQIHLPMNTPYTYVILPRCIAYV